MAVYKENALEGLRTAIVAVWTDAAANGVYFDVELTNTTLETIASENRFPFAAIAVSFAEGDWTAANQEEVGTASIYYVAKDSVSMSAMWTKLEALRDYLYDNAITGCLLIGNPVTQYNLFTPLQAYFMSVGRPLRAGEVRLVFHCGESA